MRRIAAALVITTLVLVAAAGLATASPAGQESCLAGERPGGGTGRYRTFTEGYLKGLPLSGGYFSCLKSQPPYTFFWQDWYGVRALRAAR